MMMGMVPQGANRARKWQPNRPAMVQQRVMWGCVSRNQLPERTGLRASKSSRTAGDPMAEEPVAKRRPETDIVAGQRRQVGWFSVDVDVHTGVYVLALHWGGYRTFSIGGPAQGSGRSEQVALERWVGSRGYAGRVGRGGVGLGHGGEDWRPSDRWGRCGVGRRGRQLGDDPEPSGVAWSQFPARVIVADVTGYPTALDASVRSIAMADAWFGDSSQTESLTVVLAGNVATCGWTVNGELVRDSGFVDGRIGHLRVGSEEVECSCGSMGCLEAGVRGDVYGVAAQSILGDEGQSARDVYAATRTGKAVARRLVAAGAAPIAWALGVIDAVVGRGLMILVGSRMIVCGAGELTAVRGSPGDVGNALRGIGPMRVRIARFGEEAIVVRPAALALDRFYKMGMRS